MSHFDPCNRHGRRRLPTSPRAKLNSGNHHLLCECVCVSFLFLVAVNSFCSRAMRKGCGKKQDPPASALKQRGKRETLNVHYSLKRPL